MLVLSRRQKESVFINDNVTVTVLSIRGHQVNSGIDAPRDVHVCRKEAQDRPWRQKVALRTMREMEGEPR